MDSKLIDVVVSLGPWNWFILAAALFILEVIAPGSFMLWFGLSAIVVGGVSLVIDLSWQMQLIAFAAIAAALTPVWRYFAHKVESAGAPPFIANRADTYIGRVVTLEKPIVDGAGSVRIDDTIWRISGPDCPAGSRVRIAGAEGASLMVEAA